jgi:hypothetical protein
VAPGELSADIAKAAILSEGTVRNYLSAAVAKTGGRTRAEAVRIAESGWLLQGTDIPGFSSARRGRRADLPGFATMDR